MEPLPFWSEPEYEKKAARPIEAAKPYGCWGVSALFFRLSIAEEASFFISFKVWTLPSLTSVAASPMVVLELMLPVKAALIRT